LQQSIGFADDPVLASLIEVTPIQDWRNTALVGSQRHAASDAGRVRSSWTFYYGGLSGPVGAENEKHAREIGQSTPMKTRMQVLSLDPVGGSAKDFLRNYEATGPVIEKRVKVSGTRAE